MSDKPIEFGARLEKVSLEPGDVLLIRTKEIVSMAVLESIKDACVGVFPGSRVLILPPFVDVAVLDGETVRNLIIAGGPPEKETPE